MLKVYISWLSELNKKLEKDYAKIRFTLICMPLLLFGICILIIILYRNFGRFQTERIVERILPLFLSIVSLVLTGIIFRKICYPLIERYKSIYDRAQKISDQIVDKADWTNFRKRELHNPRRTQVIETVQEFYKIRNKRFFPYYTIHSYYSLIQKMMLFVTSMNLIGIFILIFFTLDPEIYNTIKNWLHLFP